jgi:hypothetical protein
MTKEQRESLDRVKAQLAYGHYNSDGVGSYNASDIENVLLVIQDLEDRLGCVREDLIDIQNSFDDNHLKSLLASSLTILEQE